MAKKMQDMSLAELQTSEKTLLKIIPLFLGVIVLLIGSGVYLTVQKGFGIFTVLPILFVAILLTNIASLKGIRKEIAARTK